jgi:hypothetical protein
MNDIKTSQQLKDAIDRMESAFDRVVRGLKRLETSLSPEEMPKAPLTAREMPKTPKPSGPPAKRPLTHKCSVCGEKGHNKRTCGSA